MRWRRRILGCVIVVWFFASWFVTIYVGRWLDGFWPLWAATVVGNVLIPMLWAYGSMIGIVAVLNRLWGLDLSPGWWKPKFTWKVLRRGR